MPVLPAMKSMLFSYNSATSGKKDEKSKAKINHQNHIAPPYRLQIVLITEESGYGTA